MTVTTVALSSQVYKKGELSKAFIVVDAMQGSVKYFRQLLQSNSCQYQYPLVAISVLFSGKKTKEHVCCCYCYVYRLK